MRGGARPAEALPRRNKGDFCDLRPRKLRPQKLGREEGRGVSEALPRLREEEEAEKLTRDGRGLRWMGRKRG
eukprot:924446-Rhodomonas_salina.1